jgi:hypothetical protein
VKRNESSCCVGRKVKIWRLTEREETKIALSIAARGYGAQFIAKQKKGVISEVIGLDADDMTFLLFN